LSFVLGAQHYPFWSEGRRKKVKEVRIAARTEVASIAVMDATDGARSDELTKDTALGLVAGRLATVESLVDGQPVGEFKIELGDQALEDLWIAIRWGGDRSWPRSGKWCRFITARQGA